MRIEHVGLNVEDPVGAAEWLVKHMGMRVVRKAPGPTNTHFLADSKGASVLEIYRNDAAPVPDYAAQDPLVLHIAFEAADVTAERDRLVEAGATPVGKITVTPAGDELAMVRGPGGLAIQLVKRAERFV